MLPRLHWPQLRHAGKFVLEGLIRRSTNSGTPKGGGAEQEGWQQQGSRAAFSAARELNPHVVCAHNLL